MMGKITHVIERGGAEVDLADVVTSLDANVRLGGRYVASGAVDALITWVESERRAGTDTVDILFVLTSMQTQLLASIVGNTLPDVADQKICDLWIADIRRNFVEHARACRASIGGTR
jgi:hypothetical protein